MNDIREMYEAAPSLVRTVGAMLTVCIVLGVAALFIV
jgi:hypothetical protein